jgi:hypothetical protein
MLRNILLFIIMILLALILIFIPKKSPASTVLATPDLFSHFDGANYSFVSYQDIINQLLQPSSFYSTTYPPNGGIFFINNMSALDTGITRPAADVLSFGNGLQNDTSAVLQAASFISKGNSASVSGCSNSGVLGGANAGSFVSGTNGVCTVTITLGNTSKPPNGYACFANNDTNPTNEMHKISTSLTDNTITLSGTTTSGDVISWGVIGY